LHILFLREINAADNNGEFFFSFLLDLEDKDRRKANYVRQRHEIMRDRSSLVPNQTTCMQVTNGS